MSEDTLENTINMLVALQCDMSDSLIRLIFTYDSDHYIQKWVKSGKNLLLFYNSLDSGNKNILINYIK